MGKAYEPDQLATRLFTLVTVGILLEIAAMVFMGF